MIKAGIVGGTGYTGVELLRLLVSGSDGIRGRDGLSREPALLVRECGRLSPELARRSLEAELAWLEKVAATGAE